MILPGPGGEQARDQEPRRAKVTRATCVCCQNLGVLPHTDTTEVYDAVAGRMVPVNSRSMVPGETVLKMCDDCVLAAFMSNGSKPHPHRIARVLIRRQS